MKRFKVRWTKFATKYRPQIVGMSFFREDNGFTASSIKHIVKMEVGDMYELRGSEGRIHITRLLDVEVVKRG